MSPKYKEDLAGGGSDSESESGSGTSDDSSSGSESESGSGSDSSNKASDAQHDSDNEDNDESKGNDDTDVEVEQSENDQEGSDQNRDDEGSNQERSRTKSSSQEDRGTDEGTASDSRKENIRNILREAAACPDLYEVRRSSRSRKEVERLTFGNDSDSDRPKRGRRGRAAPGKKRGVQVSEDDDDSSDSDSSEFSDGYRPATKKSTRQSSRRAAPKRGRRPPARKPTRGRRKADSDETTDSEEERMARNAARNRGPVKKVSYKEQSDAITESDDLISMDEMPVENDPKNDAETVERVLLHRIGLKAATGHRTTLYNVLDNGDPNNGFDPNDPETEGETQYFIKWKNWSHIHNTWETFNTLNDVKANGMKKLDNYIRTRDEINDWKSRATREDIEYFDCQNEMAEDLIQNYYSVERVVAEKGNGDFPDYLVKWQGLPYSECTWEDGKLVTDKFGDHVELYRVRNKSQKIPNKYCKALKHRPKFVPFKYQPSFIGNDIDDSFQLRDYQLAGLNWMTMTWCKHNGGILADEMGLGKTIQSISFLSVLCTQFQVFGPFLIVVPLSTIAAWQTEFTKWAPSMNVVVYLGDVNSRNKIREYEWCHPGNKKLKFNVILTTYEILLKDKSFLGGVSWSVLAIDEAHRLKNDDSLLYKTLINFDTNHRLLITGTPLQNSLKELWSLLHFIMPDKFDDWSEFEDRHSTEDKTGFGRLHKELEPFLLRRVKKDVEKSLPSKTEQILRVEMSALQRKYYKWILTKNYKALSKGLKGSVISFANLIMELKKCCNHAYLIRPPDDEDLQGQDHFEALVKGSGKLLLLDKLLLRLKESGHRVLIFSQMVLQLDILADYLKMRHFPFQRLDGSIKGEIRKQALEHFNADGSEDFCFLLSTRAGGLGINLATADTVIIFDSDWNPQNDLQAQARAHRIGQKKQVSVYRLVTKGSVEEEIVERAKKKMVLDHLVIQRMDTTGRTVLNRNSIGSSSSGGTNPFNKDELNSILKFGAADLFKDEDDDDDEVQVDIDDILNRAETRTTEENTGGVGDELLSQFKIVSFDNLEDEQIAARETGDSKDWEDIIPENERQKVDNEERQRQMLELNLGPRERKQIRDLNKLLDSDEEKHSRRRKKRRDIDDYSEDSEDDSEEDRPRRRGRKAKELVGGCSDAEIRRFVKSFKKFPNPLERLDDIAGDAELQEISSADLRKLAETLYEGCVACMKEDEMKKEEENPNPEEKKQRNRGPHFKIANVNIAAKALFQSIEELEILVKVMPKTKEERKTWTINCHVKNAHFDCDWDEQDDSSLLRGVYEFGIGNWDVFKMDTELNLQDKILPDGDMKPQAKHLQTRAEYLLKVLMKQEGGLKGLKAIKTPGRPKGSKAKQAAANAKLEAKKVVSKEFIEDSDSDSNSDPDKTNKENEVKKEAKKKKKEKKEKKEKKDPSQEEDGESKKEKKEKKKEKKDKKKEKKKKTGPIHITTKPSVMVASEADTLELPQETFSECKEKMRPVKKALRQLDNPNLGLTDKEQLTHTRQCLLKIGDHINDYLSSFNDPDVIKEWRSNLWIFVSKFTEFDATRLHKLYKHATKKRDEGKAKGEKDPTTSTATSSAAHTSHYSQNSNTHNRGYGEAEKRSKEDRNPKHPESLSDNSRESARFDNAYNRPLNRYGDASRNSYDVKFHHEKNSRFNNEPRSHDPRTQNDPRAQIAPGYHRDRDGAPGYGSHQRPGYRQDRPLDHRGGDRPERPDHRGDRPERPDHRGDPRSHRPDYGRDRHDQGNGQAGNFNRSHGSGDNKWRNDSRGDRGNYYDRKRKSDHYMDADRRPKEPRMSTPISRKDPRSNKITPPEYCQKDPRNHKDPRVTPDGFSHNDNSRPSDVTYNTDSNSSHMDFSRGSDHNHPPRVSQSSISPPDYHPH